jgi:hypothetical protein
MLGKLSRLPLPPLARSDRERLAGRAGVVERPSAAAPARTGR